MASIIFFLVYFDELQIIYLIPFKNFIFKQKFGTEGVKHAINLVRDELKRTMQLSGKMFWFIIVLGLGCSEI